MNIREELISLSEEKYKIFSLNLIPGCDNMLGVRIPILRKLASKIIKEDYEAFLNDEELYFEEVMLKSFVITKLKLPLEEKFKLLKIHIPKITNWSLCDSLCSSLKIKDDEKIEYFNFIKQYLYSNNTYDIRFGLVTLLGYYITEEYLEISFKIFDEVKCEDYYVKMALAWAISMYFVKYPDETMIYLKNNSLDVWTYNKSLQKIIESYAVSADTKCKIKEMKRK